MILYNEWFLSFRSQTQLGCLCDRFLSIDRIDDLASDLGAERVTDCDDKAAWKLQSNGNQSGLIFIRVKRDCASIARLYTLKEERRKGHARRLMDEFVQAADENRINLRCYAQPFDYGSPEEENRFLGRDYGAMGGAIERFSDRDWLLPFYEEYGFKVVDRKDRAGLMIRERY